MQMKMKMLVVMAMGVSLAITMPTKADRPTKTTAMHTNEPIIVTSNSSEQPSDCRRKAGNDHANVVAMMVMTIMMIMTGVMINTGDEC